MTSAPGRSAPRTARRKNSRSGLTSASFARYSRRWPSGSRFEKNGGTRRGTGRRAVTSPPVRPLNERLKVGRCGSSISLCSNAKIWRPCRRTASALSFFESNFIARLLGALLVGVVGVEGAFLAFALLVRLQMIADERLHDGDEGARGHEEVAIKNADQLQKGVVARHDLAGLDAGDVRLGEPDAAGQVSLGPGALLAGLLQGPAHVLGKGSQSE